MVKNLSFLLIILFVCGCSPSKKIIVPDQGEADFVVTGSVVNAAVFQKGGSLALGYFKAGSGAAADDQTDQLSAMMMKGIRDTLPGENTHFSLSADDQHDPDCLLEGYIEDYGHDARAAQVKLRKNQTFLSLDGEIWLHETGEKILQFQTSTVIDLKSQNPKEVAYQIGVAIAHFIGKESHS